MSAWSRSPYRRPTLIFFHLFFTIFLIFLYLIFIRGSLAQNPGTPTLETNQSAPVEPPAQGEQQPDQIKEETTPEPGQNQESGPPPTPPEQATSEPESVKPEPPPEASQPPPPTENPVKKVELSKEPKVGKKRFLILRDNRIGFGAGGATLNGKHYPEGTVFEVLGIDERSVFIDQEGTRQGYDKRFFTGSYGTAGYITEVKWDFANGRPTGLDADNEPLKKYYHFFIMLVSGRFMQAAVVFVVMIALLLISAWNTQRRRAIWLSILLFCVLVGGGCQGAEYRSYLNKIDRIYKEQVGKTLSKNMISPMGMPGRTSLNIEHSGGYIFGNVLYVPIFLGFHVGVFYVLGLVIPAILCFFHYCFVPHPAEKYIRRVKKGEISAAVGLKNIVGTMYDFEKEGIPPHWKSENWKKRINSLEKRVKAEDTFMQEVIRLIKTKSRFD